LGISERGEKGHARDWGAVGLCVKNVYLLLNRRLVPLTLTFPTATPTQVVEPILLNKNTTTYRTFIDVCTLKALTLLHKYTTHYFFI
jgi:hypothetical protein